MNTIFGIMRRLYALLIIIYFGIGIWVTGYNIQHKPGDVLGSLLFTVLVIPGGVLFYMIVRWVVFGTTHKQA